MIEYRPFEKQEMFHQSNADIVLAAGGAGSSKTYGMIAEIARYVDVGEYNAMIFRRTYPEITAPGGIWDQATELYMGLGAKLRVQPPRRFVFPSGAKVTFSHLHKLQDRERHKGGQYHTIAFDELSTFGYESFVYLMSRNRSPMNEPARMLATTNPVAGTWLSDMVAPYIGEHGYPNSKMQGAVTWMYVDDDGKPRLRVERKEDTDRSFVMVSSTVYDNPVLLKSNPHYVSALQNLHIVERERLLKGNWTITYESGNCFNRSDFAVVDDAPRGGSVCVGFDLASSKSFSSNDPDYTAGVIMQRVNGRYVIRDVGKGFFSPGEVYDFLSSYTDKARAIAHTIGAKFGVAIEIEPGGSGKRELHHIRELLRGIPVLGVPSTTSKLERAKPLMRDVEHGFVDVVQGKWTENYLSHMHAIPEGRYDDQMDATVVAHAGIASMTISKTRIEKYI